MIRINLLCFLACLLLGAVLGQTGRRVGRLQEVFAWKQITYNIDGVILTQDTPTQPNRGRSRRQLENVFFDDEQTDKGRNWQNADSFGRPVTSRPAGQSSNRRTTSTTPRTSSEDGQYFIQYNNLPMGMERVGNRLFVSLPRRRYGIPATLNYIDLTTESGTRSPHLKPYPDTRNHSLVSVYRTRADECGRLWMVDTGLLELPDTPRQLQPPAVVIFDLNTNRQILRYELKPSDLPAANTPTGLASITVNIQNGDCARAFAYLPDLTTYGLIVYSLEENDSWRLRHNYFSFNPLSGNLNIANHRFQWSDGIFSVTLTEQRPDGCKTAYFHAMVGTQEFSVSTCVLNNRTASADPNYWSFYSLVGERGSDTQCTMHGYHAGSHVVFYADMARHAMSCWNTGTLLEPSNVAILAQDSATMVYPSDLHVTEDEVWMMTNNLPRFGYSRLNTNEYNYFIYKGDVQELISGTACEGVNGLNASYNTGYGG